MVEAKPKLRAVESRWTQYEGQQVIAMRDPLGLSDKTLLLPAGLSSLLFLCDGTRDLPTLTAGFQLRTGSYLSPSQLREIVEQLDEALLLDSPRFAVARATALRAFREVPFRPSALAGRGYPAHPSELRALLNGYVVAADATLARSRSNEICGLISPHIDYHRGGNIYARAWLSVAEALDSVDLVVILGTDHAGYPGELTPTRQNYATPWGVLPTAQDVVDALVAALGEEQAFASELNHRQEHSIELSVIWLHYLLGKRRCHLVPILCGSLQHMIEDDAWQGDRDRMDAIVSALAMALRGRRALVVAAADLAHVGPAFGDRAPLGVSERDELRKADAALLEAATCGSADQFLAPIRAERDRRRICGTAPIYWMLRLLQANCLDAQGEVTGYAQCQADPAGGSWVSVAGVIYRDQSGSSAD